jgi:outer membrane immunogenic protein
MLGMIRTGVLILGVTLSTGLLAQNQKPTLTTHGADIDVAITYVAERAKIASVDCGCFWLQGGSGDFALTFAHGIGVAANLTGLHNGNVGTGLELDKVLFAMGPRYTFNVKHHGAVFGEGLFGGVHGFNSIFPSSNGVAGAANSFAMMFGGGVDFRLAKHLRIRAVEADYVRSTLPNNADNVQNDLRLAAGVSFHSSGVH